MSKIIEYKNQTKIAVGIPFTWGTRNAWAIKVEDGDMYFLETGRRVWVSEEEIIEDVILYANSIEIK